MSYPETGTEALLHSYIQFAPNVHFVFSGSKRHLMSHIFYSPDRPFCQSTVSMRLEPLHEEIYYEFAHSFFEKKKGSFSQEVFCYIYNTLDGVTRNIQLVLNRLYETEKNVNRKEEAEEAIRHIVNRNSMQYEEFLGFLTDNQMSVVKAIAQEGRVASPQSNEFIKQYSLPSGSSVKTAIDKLIDRDIIYHTKNGYVVYDHFFAMWLKSLL